MQITDKKLTDLKPYANNPRHNAKAVPAVKESILKFGFKVPLVIDKNNVIVCGHTRFYTSKEIGLETVPCIVADDLTDEQINAFRLVDNRTSEFADWNFDKLAEELSELQDFDFEPFGFDDLMAGLELDYNLNQKDEEVIEDDYDEEPPVEPKTKYGDIYQLGNNWLMCGDSTKEEDVEKLMNGEKSDLLLTDPPYGINVVAVNNKIGGNKILDCNEYNPIIGDESTETAQKSYQLALKYSKNQIIFGGNYFTDFLKPSRCWLVWDKQNTGNFADAELAWTSFDRGVKLYHYLWNGLCREGSRDLELTKRIHPTQKPVGLIINILKDFSNDDDKILDCFGGSGSSLIACEQLDRKCYIMELSPAYCDVIIDRWEKFTGKKAEKIE